MWRCDFCVRVPSLFIILVLWVILTSKLTLSEDTSIHWGQGCRTWEGSPERCTSCYNGYFLDTANSILQTCSKCNAEWANWSAYSFNCTSCSSSSLIHITGSEKWGVANHQNESSVSWWKCPDNKYFSKQFNSWENCSEYCRECEGPNICNKCESDALKLSEDKSEWVCKVERHFYDKASKSCKPWPELWAKCKDESRCTEWISDVLTLYWYSWTCASGYYYNKNLDACSKWDKYCKECKGYPDYCTVCPGTGVVPFKGQWACQQNFMVVDPSGKWVWAPNYYKDESTDFCSKLWQKLVLNDNYKTEPLILLKKSDMILDIFLDDYSCEKYINKTGRRSSVPTNYYNSFNINF